MAIPEGKIRRSIVFPAELYEEIQKQAEKEYRNISGLICFAVEKYLQEKEKEKK